MISTNMGSIGAFTHLSIENPCLMAAGAGPQDPGTRPTDGRPMAMERVCFDPEPGVQDLVEVRNLFMQFLHFLLTTERLFRRDWNQVYRYFLD